MEPVARPVSRAYIPAMSAIGDLVRLLVSEHVVAFRVHIDRRLDELQQELRTMSGNADQLKTDVAAQTAAIQALASEVTAGLAANASAIQALKDQIASGSAVSAEDLAQIEANTKAAQDATAALTAALNPPPV